MDRLQIVMLSRYAVRAWRLARHSLVPMGLERLLDDPLSGRAVRDAQ